jgi:hypothetical protein
MVELPRASFETASASGAYLFSEQAHEIGMVRDFGVWLAALTGKSPSPRAVRGFSLVLSYFRSRTIDDGR